MKRLIKSGFLRVVNKRVCIFCLITTVTIAACFSVSDEKQHIKDLNDNMIDLRIYHENLGGSLKQNDLEIAEWLANGMDSILNVMAIHFENHRKLHNPFAYYYKNKLNPSMSKLRQAIKNRDTKNAIEAYTVLTEKCNGCHIDHDSGKEVLNLAK